MTSDLVRDAAGELYAGDPDQFIGRRGELAARARRSGAAAAARQIAGLRKPTRPAWVLNQLVRAAPEVNQRIAELGRELRKAQRSLDGAAIRELSRRRRRLIEELTRQAFTVTGQRAPAAALRDEVAATLSAALTDPQVADQLSDGTLVRAARSEGFGSAGPGLRLVPSPGAGRDAAPARGRKQAAARPEKAAARTREAAARPKPAELAAARERAAAQRRGQVLAKAEQALASAEREAEAADQAERGQQAAIRQLEEQLTQARRQLAQARIAARTARASQRRAQQALSRLRG